MQVLSKSILTSMSKKELLRFEDENIELDHSSLLLVYNEYLVRGIDPIRLQSKVAIFSQKTTILNSQTELIDDERLHRFTLIAIHAKHSKKSDEEIITLLQKHHIDQETASTICNSILDATKLEVKKHDTRCTKGGAICVIAVLVSIGFFSLEENGNNGLSLIPICFALYGAYECIVGYINKHQFYSMQKTFEKEEKYKSTLWKTI